MEQEIKLEPSEELAYWIGATQADGSLKTYKDKKTLRESVLVSFHTAPKSLEMVRRVQEISVKLLKRHSPIWEYPEEGAVYFHIGVKRLLKDFEILDIRFKDPPTPPKWTLEKPEFFGAYLAGVIDGDGSIKISGRKYPQCFIKITSGVEQTALADGIRKLLECWVGIYPDEKTTILKSGKVISGKFCQLFFLASSKTKDFVEKFIVPHLALTYKRLKLKEFLIKRYEN